MLNHLFPTRKFALVAHQILDGAYTKLQFGFYEGSLDNIKLFKML